ncbi:hypothetical protein [Paenibacillus illinoisensis]|uniref:hypothetical protein n=1 Tax=Paenibacillus illinoisensis TaxID=59845 RepID=UPI001C8EEC46|nr:hypothetical protein [Paenibacillus illinoisensis]MBY0217911.1 hypothetical protein [Paenibacillus illinoisensis]
MPEIKIKPIRPTQITIRSEKEYRDFVAFAEGQVTSDIDILKAVRLSFANHQRSQKRKRA